MKSIDSAANGIFDGFGTIVLVFSALGLISVTALNLYGGSLTRDQRVRLASAACGRRSRCGS